VIYYETYIVPETQASFVYRFRPSESFYARPFGLTINVYYKDAVSYSTTVSSHTHDMFSCTLSQEDNDYCDAVFNNTVNIIEVEESFDAET
jgi:hypothetical protein